MKMSENMYISGFAHLLRFGGLILSFVGLLIDLWFGSGFGESSVSLELYMIGFFVMAGGITVEAIYHFLEGEVLV
jgi:hypothetical protein